MSDERFVGVPVPEPGPECLLVQLDKGESIDGVILSNAVWGVGTHWNDFAGRKGRSERCTLDHGHCEGHEKQLPYRWKGYLFVFCFRRRKGVFVELTPTTAKQIEVRAPRDKPLRGERLQLKRGDGGKKTRISVEVLEYRGNVEDLPADRDPQPILEILWTWGR